MAQILYGRTPAFQCCSARLLSTVTAYELIVTYHGVPFGAGRKKITSAIAYFVEMLTSKLVKHSVVVISAQDRRSVNAIKPRGKIAYTEFRRRPCGIHYSHCSTAAPSNFDDYSGLLPEEYRSCRINYE